MLLSEAFKLALQSLWGNKMRTILTLIGVVMGVASVIMVITLVQGAKQYVSTKLSGYGSDVFTVTRMSSVIFTADDYFRYQKRKMLRFEDYEAVRDNCGECSEVGPSSTARQMWFTTATPATTPGCEGYTWTMVSLNNIDIALGRGFTPATKTKVPITSSSVTTLWTTCWETAIPSGKRFA
jgi:putative ABC transport system permease protein